MSYALQDVTSDRTVTVAGTDKLQSRFNSHTYAGRVEGGYRLDMSYIAVTPYTALQFQYTQAPSYAETSVSGSNAFALSFAANASTSTRTELGSWVDKLINLPQGDVIVLRGRAAWAHDQSTGSNINAAFQTLSDRKSTRLNSSHT